MNDTDLIQLFEARDEQAIAQTTVQYGGLCSSIAMGILGDRMDAEECVNDTMLIIWNAIPPARPNSIAAYLTTITRNEALMRYRRNTREKRGGGKTQAVLDELSDVIPDSEDVESELDRRALRESLTKFLDSQSSDVRTVFIRRYFSMYEIKEIAQEYGMTESKVKVSLLRTRKKLRTYLKKEGFL